MAVSTESVTSSPIAMWAPGLAALEARQGYRMTLAGVVLLATIGGAVLRLWNLGRLGLIVDEGFMALAVDGVLKHGLPILDHGFAYTRSFVFIYMQAACAAVLGNGPLALRLPAAIFGIIAIPVAYAMGRQFLGRTVGALLAVILAFSVWEIELSRYGRFYTLLQVLWMLAMISFHRGFIEDRRWPKVWFFVTVLVGLWVHTLMIFAGALFLMVLPRPGYSWRRRATYAGLMLVFVPLRIVTDQFILWVQAAVSGSGVVAHSGLYATARPVGRNVTADQVLAPLYEPQFDVLRAAMASNPLPLAMLAAGGLIGLGAVMVGLWRGEGWRRCLMAAAAIACGVGDQLGLALVLVMAYTVFFVRRWADLRRWHVLAAAATLVPCVVMWVWFTHVVQEATLRNAISRLFEFPNLDRYFLHWMINGWPVMTVGLVLGLVVLATRAGRGRGVNAAWCAAMAFLLPLLLACVVKSKWIEARYFFHLYPQVVMIFVVTPVVFTAWLAQQVKLRQPAVIVAMAVTVLAGTMVFSQDGNPTKSARIPLRPYSEDRDPIKSVVSWALQRHYHQDHEGVADFLRDRLKPDDVVIVVGPPHNAAIYRYLLGRVDYVFCDPLHYTRVMLDPDDRLIDDVADAVVLGTLDELRHVIEAPRGGLTWVISDTNLSHPDRWMLNEYEGSDRMYLKDITAIPTYTARDGRQTVQCLGKALAAGGE